MASLTTTAQNTENKTFLASAVTEAQAALDDMTVRIAALADFTIDQNFDFSPQELGRDFRSRALSLSYSNYNTDRYNPADSIDETNFVKFGTTGIKGKFTPVNKLTSTDIPVVNATEIPDPDEVSIDTTPPEKPTLVTVTPVVVTGGTKPGIGPEINDPNEVVEPATLIPDAPVLTGVIIPDLYSPTIPSFSAVVPEVPASFIAPSADTYSFDGGDQDYVDTQLAQLQTVLLDDLQNGGYGVFHTDEEAIFTREVDRETSAAQAVEEELFESFAAQGFPIPTGAQIDLLAKLQQQTLDKISSINREVSIQRAALVREGRTLAFGTTTQLTGQLSTYRGFFYERLLKTQQFAASYAIQALEASIGIFNLQISVFNTHATDFRLKLEAEIALLEQNKVALEKARIQQDINNAEIDLYNARMQVLSIEADIYNTKVSAAKTKADIQISKLDRYKLEYQIYAAELAAESTKVANYTAQVGANEADVRLFATETSAYSAKIDAQKTQESIYLARFEADVKRKELEFIEYESKLKLLEVELKQEADAIGFMISKYNADTDSLNAYSTQIGTGLNALKAEQEFISDEADRDLKWLQTNEELKQSALDKKVKLEIQLLETRMNGLSTIMTALSASISHTDIVVS